MTDEYFDLMDDPIIDFGVFDIEDEEPALKPKIKAKEKYPHNKVRVDKSVPPIEAEVAEDFSDPGIASFDPFDIYDNEEENLPSTEVVQEDPRRIRAKEDLDEDVAYSRQKVKVTVDEGVKILRSLRQRLEDGHVPGGLDGASKIMDKLLDGARELMGVHQSREIVDGSVPMPGQVDQEQFPTASVKADNAIVFQGNSSELLKLSKEMMAQAKKK